jgi:hypothetical protein
MTEPQPACLYCQRTSEQIPLVLLEFHSEKQWICPQHLPILIHQPARLAPFLPGIEVLEDASPDPG